MVQVEVKIIFENEVQVIAARKGDNLREVLMTNGVNLYGALSQHINCGGRGICATCGVYLLSSDVPPTHWHDKLAKKFGYPRLTCQITLTENIQIAIPKNKIIWGQLLPKFGSSAE
ncbi:MAG: 2Fe-2S iron-sulfur cluster-binding protein [Bacteroidota bacterium]